MKAIAAMARNRVIGAEGKIPWHLPEDLKFFKRTTLGHVILMGRKTYESLGRPLPGRENWVVSRTGDFPGVKVFRDLSEISPPTDGRELFVIGGAQIYEALLPRCEELYLTRVDEDVEGDAYFPAFEDQYVLKDVVFSAPGLEVELYRAR